MSAQTTSRRRRRSLAVAASLAVHLAAVLLLARPSRAPMSTPVETRAPMTLQLEAALPTRASATAAGPAARASPVSPLRARLLQATPPLPPPSTAPVAPVAPAATAAVGKPAAIEGAGSAAETEAARQALAAMFGCRPDNLARLEGAVRERCQARLLEAARTAPVVDAIAPEKRAYYDAVVAARDAAPGAAEAQLEKVRPEHEGLARSDRDVNIGYHCSFKFGVGAAQANKAAGIKLGFPPCPFKPPPSRLGAEAGVRAPESLKDRTADAGP